jgi:hypothetical protein
MLMRTFERAFGRACMLAHARAGGGVPGRYKIASTPSDRNSDMGGARQSTEGMGNVEGIRGFGRPVGGRALYPLYTLQNNWPRRREAKTTIATTEKATTPVTIVDKQPLGLTMPTLHLAHRYLGARLLLHGH